MKYLVRRARIVGIAALIAFIAVGCSGCAGMSGVKTPDQMTSTERAAMALMLYNNAYSNYLIQYESAPKPLTVDHQKYFKGYKEGLVTVYPMIYTYITIIQSGTTPTVDQEKAIISLIYQLQTMMLKEVAK
jgi:hypothetical protein